MIPTSEVGGWTQLETPAGPAELPGLVAHWDFGTRGGEPAGDDGVWRTAAGTDLLLTEQAGPMVTVADPGAPFNGRALRVDEGQWLSIPRADCPGLDIHGPTGRLTVIAWIRRWHTSVPGCEFIAGQWNETGESRQYGLFLNISVWGERDQVCGHLSTTGGPTPGHRYCMDGPVGATPIDDAWHCVAMSYDGTFGWAWLDGRIDDRPGLNPYLIPGGLHDGGPNGSDFTVGAVDRSGEIGNFFTGLLGGLAVYDRVLTPAEMFTLAATTRR
ncbi:LamG-like jellyroll fold domain-containing protein [Propionibacteriaceae bacterium Y2011]|uniref:LamG-like jellyroll fold domain-containing protein n=1 Tax=Microlunatus sp. Y2014 TaxID=3418488 RepID=UPI003B491E8B